MFNSLSLLINSIFQFILVFTSFLCLYPTLNNLFLSVTVKIFFNYLNCSPIYQQFGQLKWCSFGKILLIQQLYTTLIFYFLQYYFHSLRKFLFNSQMQQIVTLLISCHTPTLRFCQL